MCSFKRRFNKNHHYFIINVSIKRNPENRIFVELKIYTSGMKKSMTELMNTTTIRSSTVFSSQTPLIPIIPNVEASYLSPPTSDVFADELNQSLTAAASTAIVSLPVNGTGDEINSFYFYEVSILKIKGLFHLTLSL